MTTRKPAATKDFEDDDAPDLSAPPWTDNRSTALLASGPLEGVDLERARDFGRDIQFFEDGASIQTDEEYGKALREIEQYFLQEPAHNTPEAARFNELAERIRLYEDEHHDVSPPSADK